MIERSPAPNGAPPAPVATEPFGDPPLDLTRILEVLRRNRLLVTLTVALVTAATVVVALLSATPYHAVARIADAPGGGAAVDPASVEQRLAIDRVLVKSPAVLADAARRVPGETATSISGKVSATIDPDARLLDVMATDANAARAPRIANAIAAALLTQRLRMQRQALGATRQQLAAQIGRLPADPAGRDTARALRRRIGRLVVEEASAGPGLQVVEAAQVPSSRAGRHVLRSGALGVAAGLLLALLLALARDRRRPPHADARQLSASSGLPLLAALPDPPPRTVWERAWLLPRRLHGHRPTRVRGRRSLIHRRGSAQPQTVEETALGRSVRLALPPRRQRIVLVCEPPGQADALPVAAALARSLRAGGQPTGLVFPRSRDAGERDGRRRRGDAASARTSAVDAALERISDSDERYVVVAAPTADGHELRRLARRSSSAILVLRLGRASATDGRAARRMLDVLGLHGLGLVITCAPDQITAVDADDFAGAIAPSARGRASRSHNGGSVEPAHADGSADL
jgi:hypothetical protein